MVKQIAMRVLELSPSIYLPENASQSLIAAAVRSTSASALTEKRHIPPILVSLTAGYKYTSWQATPRRDLTARGASAN